MKKTLAGLAVLGLVLASAQAGAQEKIDTSGIFVKKAIAEKMTAEQLQAYKETLAQRKAAGAFDRAPAGPGATRAPGDTCSAATYELGAVPTYGPIADTTVGATDDFDLPPDVTNPTCTAAVTCTGTGPAGSLPRGAIYTGTGTGPDRGWRIKTDVNCNLTITMDPTSTQDLALITYLANCTSSLADCACVSDVGVGGANETIQLSAVAGTDYFIVTDGYSTGGTPPGPSGPYTLTITGGPCNLVPVELEGISIE
jgi:type II secretory pathway pseudopilin PulG